MLFICSRETIPFFLGLVELLEKPVIIVAVILTNRSEVASEL